MGLACQSLAQGRASVDEVPVFTEWRTYRAEDGLAHDRVRALLAVGEDLWIGTDGGLALRRDGRFTTWTTNEGLPYPVVSAIAHDQATDELWIGMWGGGLARFSAGRFDAFNQFNSGLAGDIVFDVAVLGGRVWAATNGGVSALDPRRGTWDLYLELRADGPEVVAVDLTRFDDSLHAAAWCGGVYRYRADSDDWVSAGAAGDWTGCRCRDVMPVKDTTVAIDSTGDSLVWATQTELFLYAAGDEWRSQRTPLTDSLNAFVHSVAVGPGGRAWLCTQDGLKTLVDPLNHIWVAYQRDEVGDGGRVTVIQDGKIVDTATTGDGDSQQPDPAYSVGG